MFWSCPWRSARLQATTAQQHATSLLLALMQRFIALQVLAETGGATATAFDQIDKVSCPSSSTAEASWHRLWLMGAVLEKPGQRRACCSAEHLHLMD